MNDTGIIELDGMEIDQAGSYLHLATGLLARVFPEDLASTRGAFAGGSAGRVARLSPNPAAPIDALRMLAAHRHYKVNF
jgi:hypothetical protein